MATREDRSRAVEDESRASLPSRHQGFVRSRDVHDTKSQAKAPSGPGHEFDRSGEKHYEEELREFENEHDADVGDDDRHLRTAIRQRLAEAAGIDASAIEISVSDGVATLTGHADAAARQRAEEIAASIGGVASVRNQIDARD